MKANRAFRTRDEAVSNVLGGILFFSLIFLVIALIRLEFVPIWEEDKEAAHLERVSGQFLDIKSEVDRQAANRTSLQVSHPVTLGFTSTSRFFTPSNLPGTLTFESQSATGSVSASELLVLAQAGRSTAAIDEDWISITGPVTLESVGEISHLRIRVERPWDETSGDNITLVVTDADGKFAGSLTVYLHKDPPEFFLNARVIGPSGSIIYDQGEAFHQISTVNYWWIDALEDVLHFTDVLNAARTPFTLSLEENGMQGDYTLTYTEQTGTGSVLVGSSGVTIPDFNVSLAGGVLHMDASSNFFVDQDFFLENGAVILQQPDGAAIRVPPDLSVRAGSTLTRVALTLPALTGDSDSIAQKGTVSIATDTASSNQLQGTAPDFTYTVQTQFPSVWTALFTRVAQDGGLSAALNEFAVSSTPDSATLTICGASRDCDSSPPASTDHDLSIDLAYASIRTTFDS